MRTYGRVRAVGIAFWIAHVVILTVLHQDHARVVLSTTIQLAIGLLTVVACLQAAQRSGPFGRMFWRLATIGFSLLVVGLGLAAYGAIFTHGFQPRTWVFDMFVNAWTAPLVMCLFLDPEAEPTGIDWQRILDFAQVGIVFVLLYLYTSSLAAPGEEFEPWRLALATDALITAGFFARGATTRSNPAKMLFWRFGYFRLVSVCTDALFVLGFPETPAGNWFDVVWSLTTLIPLTIATGWSDLPTSESAARETTSHRRLLVTQLIPLIFPVLVIIMASQIVHRQLVLVAVAVLVSLAITYGRLLITQREQLRSAEALRVYHHLLRSIMEGASEAIFVKDAESRYLLINTPGAQMLGRSVAEVLGKNDFDLFPAETAQFVQKIDEQVIQSGTPRNYEMTASLPGGDRVFLATKSPYLDPNGKMVGLIGTAMDVTDRRKLEDQLRQTQKMEAIGTLSGGVAHDFNNLLTIIKGYNGLLLDSVKDEKLRSYAEHVDEASEQATSLTRQLLAFSRRQVLQPRVINLNILVTNLHKMLRRMIGEDIEIRTAIEPNLGSVKADPGQIEQVIMNLVINARDAMPAGGKLTLETANVEMDETSANGHASVVPGRYVMLAVSDSGVGMDAETQDHVFEPFFTTKEMGRGTGLGLSMVYGIVKQSGGTIWVYSEPGRGTTFKIYLPMVEEPAEPLPSKQRPGTNIRGTETILLVEDNRQVRELAQSLLTACGYVILAADSAASAISLCEQHRGVIHLLATDVVMPESGGRELATQIQAMRPGIRVLYMSGYTDNAIIRHGVLEPGTFFLQKPFTPASLAGKIRETLDSTMRDA